MSPEVAAPDAGQVIGGKYALTRVIGTGGMGIVYEAVHVRLRQRVALKLLLPDLKARPDVVARFEREARAAVPLSGAHVARVLDVDVLPDGLPYMVMEYLEGRDLAAELAERGPLPVHEAVDYVLQACMAMVEAHRLGTVHRDLKPGNLFLNVQGAGRVLKVIDFGISKIADESALNVTATFSALGTAPYMSPEQVRSAKNVDARSDVWALGVILHELLAGKPPFEGDNIPAVVAAITADAPRPLRALRPEVPAALEAAVLRALQKDRDNRFADVTSFAAALAPYRVPNAAPEVAPPEAEVPVGRAAERRGRGAIVVAVGALAAAAVAIAMFRGSGGSAAPAPAAPAAVAPAPPSPAAAPVEPAPPPEAPAAPPAEAEPPAPKKVASAKRHRHKEKPKPAKRGNATKPTPPARKVDLPDSPG